MKDKIKIAINWAGACGGCDVAVLDLEERVLDITSVADIVYWPVAMDFKREDLFKYEDNSIDITLFNGMIRTSEHKEDAELLRQKSKVMIAFGSCACFGGIPGMANFTDREGVFNCAYKETVSSLNPDGVFPATDVQKENVTLTLPGFQDHVNTLEQVVDVDYFLPGCPPTTNVIIKAVEIIAGYKENGDLPDKGSIIAGEKALCSECKRNITRTSNVIGEIIRPHEKDIDPDLCFLEQGIICMGPFTRSGCGSTCIEANMPCRGCFGPAEYQYDQGTEALSAFGSAVTKGQDDNVPRGEMLRPVNSIKDPLGTFYRFSLPNAIINKNMKEEK
jgi:F420-non-reducing hydrogenase small subunit